MSKGVSLNTQISRSSLFWLLFAQFALIAPHLDGLPWWLFLVCAFCGFWRIQVYRGKYPFAGTFTRVVMIAGSLVAVIFSYLDNMGLDAAVTFLILVFFLKLLETRRARDMYVTIFLGYFVAATQLLYSQSFISVVYATVCYLLLSVSLLALHQRETSNFGLPIARAGMLMLQGLPILLVLFLFFPRIDPLWLVPLPNQGNRPGLDDTVNLGSFSTLAQNSKAAFRVSFDGAEPAMEELYWRGVVFEEFDGESWHVSPHSEKHRPWKEWPYKKEKGGYSYNVILEPSRQNWLFALPLARPLDPGIRTTAAFNLRQHEILNGRQQYKVLSSAYKNLELTLDKASRDRNLALPEDSNPASREMAEQLASNFTQPRQIADAVMTMFNQQAYYYTLRPPVYAEHSIDGFLTDSKQGYCEHYAAAFVFLLRAAGIPARMVGGYLGGEYNPFEDYLSVRQMDAHAWAEAWFEGEGWVRFDPTAQVAPERVSSGVETTLRQRDEFFSGGFLSQLSWARGARLWWDSVNYGWAQWFLNYDRESQMGWMEDWFGRGDLSRLVQVLAFALSAVFLLLLLWMFRAILFRKRAPAHAAAMLFNSLLGLLGSHREAPETMVNYCARVAQAYPRLANTLTEFSAVYSALAYADLRYNWVRRFKLHWLVLKLAGQVLAFKLNPAGQLTQA